MKFLMIIALASATFLYSCGSNDATASNQADNTQNAATASTNDVASTTSIQWIDSVHQELGKVKEGGVVEVSWKFKNTGSKPLVISNVNASCGCTVADKPEQPIAPGAEGVISAKFDSKGRDGAQRKDVYVTANTENSNHQLSFAVDVTKQ
jgi:hypothetical protein